MGEIIARFADGRLLVQEDRLIDTNYVSGGVLVRVGYLQTVEKILSLGAHVSGHPEAAIAAPIAEAAASGDRILVKLRRMDLASGGFSSGLESTPLIAESYLSGITSGIRFGGQLTSGKMTSGRVTVFANVIGR